jgi:hypothetical protein
MMSLDPVLGKQGADDKETAEKEFRSYIGQSQHWNRYSYTLNNPLRFVDDDGFGETITVQLNIVYDDKSNYSEKEKEQFRKQFIEDAKNKFGNVDIQFNITETTGNANGNKITINEGSPQINEKGAITTFVTKYAPVMHILREQLSYVMEAVLHWFF